MKGSIRQRTPGSYEFTIDIGHIELTKLAPSHVHAMEARVSVDLRGSGARVQRPLWASTSVKNPAYDDLLYVRSLMARDTVTTMPRVTIDTLMERGIDAGHMIDDAECEAAECGQAGLRDAGIDMDGVTAFADSYDMLMRDIETASGKLAVG